MEENRQMHWISQFLLTLFGAFVVCASSTVGAQATEARAEFFDRLSSLGVARALKRRGVKQGDLIRIGQLRIRWDD